MASAVEAAEAAEAHARFGDEAIRFADGFERVVDAFVDKWRRAPSRSETHLIVQALVAAIEPNAPTTRLQ
ncbi:hypothetical protein RUR49_12405 [Pseudoxanthobacter sp. M-2]|uniref:hypothetical protein n=1 Tax=Pseudoxanthobacter sp. M-2 TaxID=3078754 RepID=UPI0038FC5BBF